MLALALHNVVLTTVTLVERIRLARSIDIKTGWYEPSSSKEFTSGNVIDDKFVTHDIARKVYRLSCGVKD